MIMPQSGISQHVWRTFERSHAAWVAAFPHGILHAHPTNLDIVTESRACSSMDMKHQLDMYRRCVCTSVSNERCFYLQPNTQFSKWILCELWWWIELFLVWFSWTFLINRFWCFQRWKKFFDFKFIYNFCTIMRWIWGNLFWMELTLNSESRILCEVSEGKWLVEWKNK